MKRLIESERRTMKNPARNILVGICVVIASMASPSLEAEAHTAEQLTFFEEKISPVLAEPCY